MAVEIHIFDKLETESFAAGQDLITQGQASGFMYAIVEGTVEVMVDEKRLHDVGPGGIVGEMALIDSAGSRSATVRAKTDVKAVPVDEARFKFLVEQTPFFALQVMRVLVERLREATALGANYLD